ncbi:uncharacterized protein N7446_013158 [Penicillium canescens]|uniref:Peptidase M20 domain-containing protein 2 n=1 Tax=Penicillium canescens TaxID=5083 RepID=A0AAD6HYQ6_PENCN|nr:uncharacterized protein N7446_013158 [Penicillium canescens]KAJ6022806.1 hypothetical protein N7460_013201 [Penicillium canescens]KAJ6042092.1 hypothetical protein N7446_013158 [Penicillium canescens]
MLTVQEQTEIIQKVRGALNQYEAKLSEINQKASTIPSIRQIVNTDKQQIWSNPELAFKEYNAHNNICTFFESLNDDNGYKITRKAYGIETALEITHKQGHGGRIVAFNAEYDALPGMGHACGHNLIATSSIAAFLATVETMKALYSNNRTPSTSYDVRLFGTPAEEGGGGKLLLINAGAYKSVDACFMVHPFPILSGAPDLLSSSSCTGQYLANDKVQVTYTGKPAHASAAPWEGVNALDAVVSAYVGISMLRQQIKPTDKIHGVVLRGVKELRPLTEKVVKCFEAAATATGCTVEFEWEASYKDMKINKPICDSYVSAMNAMGHSTIFDAAGQEGGLSGGSTDMGNVSYEVPSFHGGFYIATDGVNHTPQFTAGAGSEEGFQRSLHCAAGMAVVACRNLVDDSFAKAVESDFRKDNAL